ncbi:lysosomal alpha-glucosidase-like [Ptychodera flava]|uniref:lysosomal alpha-glucosidase-like n=1 Tax=Ptychodera flava TaxID=63121 RepID=UPI00396A437E
MGRRKQHPTKRIALPLVMLLLTLKIGLSQKCTVDEKLRFDCYPEDGGTQQTCEERGCCWRVPKGRQNITSLNSRELPPLDIPYCYYPSDFPTYSLTNRRSTDYGYTADLKRSTKSYYPNDIMQLKIDVYMETETRVHFKIYDPSIKRYEVPIETPKVTKKVSQPKYEVDLQEKPFSIRVARFDPGQGMNDTIFNTNISTSFIYTDQFIQLSSFLPTLYIYGLGEHRGSFLHDVNWTRYTMWARDKPPEEHVNLYGSHPFYLAVEPNGYSHGVFLLNSNAMDVILQPTPAITYRTIGGILDFYVFLGPSPEQVIQQYSEVIGRPFMPPYWSLGFHLCRWGYNSANRTMEIVKKMRLYEIPQDTQWNDIDYMDNHLDWTYDKTNFAELGDLVKDLHAHGQHYINIVDPAISNKQPKGSYQPYDDGIAMKVFITFDNGTVVRGSVWPGETVFPDFTNPTTKQWWQKQAKIYHDQIPFDGMWIDMNEPSNFVDGSPDGCPDNNYENPPYVPDVLDDKLSAKTICASSKQYWSMHYNVHNLYGLSEMIASHDALVSLRGTRPFVISRSTFPSAGKYGGHWLGDNDSQWKDMYYSIPGILNFNMYGIPMVGADICGFNSNTTPQLCQRWQQLGAFYPFSRNHNTLNSIDQDPTQFDYEVRSSIAEILKVRYSLLPYLYLLFHKSHISGTTIARPLMFEFSMDKNTYSIDKQFLWGSALLISPVLDQDATSVQAYFPDDRWYDFYTGDIVTNTSSQGKYITLDAPTDKLNLHVRAGHILPMQDPALTTTASRQNKFALLVAPTMDGVANGELFWDDGETIGTYEKGLFTSIKFSMVGNKITSRIVKDGYPGSDKMMLGTVTIFNVVPAPKSVRVNGQETSNTYDFIHKVLTVQYMSLPLTKSFVIDWSY